LGIYYSPSNSSVYAGFIGRPGIAGFCKVFYYIIIYCCNMLCKLPFYGKKHIYWIVFEWESAQKDILESYW